MRLKIITAFIIAANTLLLSEDLPIAIAILIFCNLILSFFIAHKVVRNTIKVALLIGAMAILRQQFKVLLVAECVISFTLFLSSLKFWELEEERDHFNMFLILALCVCCVFLLNPTFLIFAYGIGTMLFYFYYILKIRGYDVGLLNVKRLILLVTPAVAVSLVLFYTFPRFTQGFINSNEMQYMIGGNSKIKFSDLGPLSTSSESAFRVRGLGESNLPFKIIYWRSSVLWQMSGNEWISSNATLKQEQDFMTNSKFKYEIEALQKYVEYLPTLDGSSNLTFANQNFTSYEDGTFKLKNISRVGANYSVSGNYGDPQKSISSLMIAKGLKLPKKTYDGIKKAYFKEAKHSEVDSQRLKELIQIFKAREFAYSLTPPKYSSVEEFLINGRYGYCSHFAAGFALLARLYDLPSRIVTGYLGGQFNPYDGSVLVREMDAHAWVEIYIKEKGWVKVDPTGLVIPARLTQSADEFNNNLNPYITVFDFKISRQLLSFALANDLSLWIDSLNSKLSTSLINFDRDKQLQMLRSLTPKNFSIGWIFAFSLLFSLLVMWFLFFIYGKKRLNPNERRYLKFIRRMRSYSLLKEEQETISHFQKRCLNDLPEQESYINREVTHYIEAFYKN